MDDIRYLKHSEINKEMWDACVMNSSNGLIYARSWYLDAMSPNWEALVHRDYIAVMPLTVSGKMGITYLSQPAFSQQLGIIGPLDFPEEVTQKFIDIACSKFPLVEINLNFKNKYASGTEKCNLILDLEQPFEEIKLFFKKDLIPKARKANLKVEASTDYEEVILFFQKLYAYKIPHLKNKHFDRFLKVCNILSKDSKLIVRRVVDAEGKPLACALFFKDEKRIYYMMSATFSEGRRLQANALILYEVIKEFSGSTYTFDFEGSSIPSIHFFFKKFNAVEEKYPVVRINNLSPLIRKMKTIFSSSIFN